MPTFDQIHQTHKLPDFQGFGLGFRPCHYQAILETKPKGLDWLEVISENFINIGGRPRSILEQARDIYPIALHGVGLSLGSPEEPSLEYLNGLKALLNWVRPFIVSDHLSFSSLGGHNSHDLLPIPYTKSILDRIVQRLERIQDFLGVRFFVENPSAYVAFKNQDYLEIDFLCELISRSGCGVLLDVNNLYVNQMNLGLDPLSYIGKLPANSVGQIHLAGHSKVETPDGVVRIDTHDQPILDEVWSLYKTATGKFKTASVMIEWDDHIPSLDVLLDSLKKSRELHSKFSSASAYNVQESKSNALPFSDKPISQDQVCFFEMAVDSEGIKDNDLRLSILSNESPVSVLCGTRVYNGAYFSRLCEVLKSEFPTLAGVTTEDSFAAICSHYLQAHKPSQESVNELGINLPAYLRDNEIIGFDFGVERSVLFDLAAFDLARRVVFTNPSYDRYLTLASLKEVSEKDWDHIKFSIIDAVQVLKLSINPIPTWDSIQKEEAPDRPELEDCALLVYRNDLTVAHWILSDIDAILIQGILDNKTFKTTVDDYIAHTQSADLSDAVTRSFSASLVDLFSRGLVSKIELL